MYEQVFQQAYEKLNPQQKQAVDIIEGPVMVLAGPGTGKTQILALRIANILRQTQMDPQNILALTFTESGAIAMRSRLINFIGPAAYYVQIYTFHSFCNKVIQENPQFFAKTRELQMLTDIDRVQVLQKAIDSVELEHLTNLHNKYYYLNTVSSAISTLKRENVTPKKLTNILSDEFNSLQLKLAAGDIKEESIAYKKILKDLQKNKELLKIYLKFQELLANGGYYDYDDMILFVIEAWEKEPFLLATYQERFQYILADEYQDTNNAQNAVLFKLAEYFERPNLFVVGDDDQAIYRFQGASVENLFIFLNRFTDTQKINLKTNYRSTQIVLDAAHSLITNNKLRVKDENSTLMAYNTEGDKPLEFWQFLQGEQENAFIVDKILQLQSDGVPLSEISIISRDNKDLDELYISLLNAGIPAYNHSAADLMSDPVVNYVLDFWKLLLNLRNDLLFGKVINQPWSKVEKLSFYKLSRARNSKTHFFDILADDHKLDDLSENERHELIKFRDLLLDLQRREKQIGLARFAREFIEHAGIRGWVKDQPNKLEILTKLTSLINLIESHSLKKSRLNLEEFLDLLDIMNEYRIKIPEQKWSPQSELVQLMTAHKSKGLEFDYVFMPKVHDGKWGNRSVPSLLKLPDSILEMGDTELKDPNEDERRLFYVALTRARKHIWLSQANEYHYQGSDKKVIVSMFIDEINCDFITKQFAKDTVLNNQTLSELLNDKLSPVQDTHTELEKDYLRSLLLNFRLSPSSLHTWQNCQREFFYKYVLRLPQDYSPSLGLGTAVHFALEKFFLDFKIGKEVNESDLINYFRDGMKKLVIDESDFGRILQEGEKILSQWLVSKLGKLRKPLFLEYNFGSHNINLDGIPLTGKVDKVELINEASKAVKIIDYKTGSVKSKNAIMGKTKTDDGHIYQQLVFYRLLADLDPMFTYNVKEVEIDFIKPRSSGKHATISFEIPESDVENLKKIIKQSYDDIQNLNYPLLDVPCQCTGECAWMI